MKTEVNVRVTGWLAIAVTASLWSSFALTARFLGGSSLDVVDAAILRFATPLLFVWPLIPRTLRALRGERAAVMALILAGGLPQYAVMSYGADRTSAALTGMLVPGTVPLFVTLIAVVGLRSSVRQLVTRTRAAALGTISAGVLVSSLLVGSGASLTGICMLLAAGLFWAVYTTGLQRTTLRPMEVVTGVCLATSAASLLLAISGAMPSTLLSGRPGAADVITIVVLQGVGTGLLSTMSYAFAVRALDGSRAAVGGAASPVLTALVAVPLFAEPISPGLGLALLLIVGGITTYNLGARPSYRLAS